MAEKRTRLARPETAMAIMEGGIATADQNLPPPSPPKWWIPVVLLADASMEVLRLSKAQAEMPLPFPLNFFFLLSFFF